MKPLAFNMSKFEKVGADKNSTTMRHEDGHEIKIAHKALSAIQRKQLEKMPMCTGGKVHHYDDGTASATPTPSPLQSMSNSVSNPQTQGGGSSDNSNGNTFLEKAKNYFSYDEGTADAGSDDTSDQPPVTVNVNAAPGPQMGGIPQTPQNLQAGNVNASGVQPPAANTAVNPNAMFNKNQTNNIPNAQQAQMLGANQEAQANSGMNQDLSPIQQKAIDYQEQQNQAYIAKKNQYDQESQHLLGDIKDIDPKRLMNSMTAPKKVMTALGLMLGGIGYGAIGQTNHAAEFLNQQVNRDVEAQKTNQTKGFNVYNAYRQATGSDLDAMTMTKNAQLQIYGDQAKKLAMQYNTPLAWANYNKFVGQLAISTDKNNHEAAMNAVIGTPMGPGQNVNRNKVPAGNGNSAPVVGGTATQGNPPSATQKVSPVNQAIQNAKNITNKAASNSGPQTQTELTPDADNKIADLQYGNSQQQADYQPTMEAMNDVKQAEAVKTHIKELYKEAIARVQHGGKPGRVGRAFEPSTVGALPGGEGSGNLITGAVNAIKEPLYKLASTDNTRRLDSLKSEMKKYVAQAVSRTKLGSGDINSYIDDHFPEYGNEASSDAANVEGIGNYIDTALEPQRTLLKKYNALKSKK